MARKKRTDLAGVLDKVQKFFLTLFGLFVLLLLIYSYSYLESGFNFDELQVQLIIIIGMFLTLAFFGLLIVLNFILPYFLKKE